MADCPNNPGKFIIFEFLGNFENNKLFSMHILEFRMRRLARHLQEVQKTKEKQG